MTINKLKQIGILLILVSLFSCKYNSSVMMRTPNNYQFDEPPKETEVEYIISNSDIIEFSLYTNSGSVLVDLTAITEQSSRFSPNAPVQYLVDFNGIARFPIIGETEVKGKTIRELEAMLEELYAKYYIKPFVKALVTNKRVTVFPGGSGAAQIVPLANSNMRLIEALGAVGGLTKLAKAKRIKLIRGDLKDPQVFLFDFSTINGLTKSDFVLQANDIIYIEPRSDYLQELIRDIAPVISLVASSITLIVVIRNTQNP